MKSKLAQIIFSTRLMAVLFIVFAAAMIAGTFLDMGAETSPTPYSRTLVYNAWWFEAIMGFFIVNFIGNIFRYRLHKKEKWATLTLHLAFIFILLGAFITRYIGYEGVMPIREGASNDKILSEKVYLKVLVDGDYMIDGEPQRRVISRPLMLSEKLNNDFEIPSDYNGAPIEISHVNFIEGAERALVPDPTGKRYIKLVEASGGNRHDHYLEEGQVSNIHNMLFAFNNYTKGAVNITDKDGEYPTIETPFQGTVMRMADQQKSSVVKDSIQALKLRSLYDIGEMQFVIPEPVMKGKYEVVKAKDPMAAREDALTIAIKAGNEVKELTVLGGKGTVNKPKSIKVGGLEFHVSYGSKEIPLPFAIKLNDFIAEKYPGNDKAYKSFKSKVTVLDGDAPFDYDIFMNNILNYRGYKFFQAQFDPDEKGTILSVNHDQWGTWVSYLGYFLLFGAMLWIIVDKNTRFGDLRKQLKKVKAKKSQLTVLLFFLGLTATVAQDHERHRLSKEEVDSIIQTRAFPKEEAAKFGALVIQDFGGRMKPVNTYASELLRKVYEKDSYEGLDANQVFLSMIQNNRLWFEAPIIKLKRGNDSIRKVLQVPLDTKYVALADFFDGKGNHRISDKQLEDATKAFNPNQFQKDIKKAYEREQLLSQALLGSILKIYPIPDDPNDKWVSYAELGQVNYGSDEANNNIRNLLPYYISTLHKGKETGDYSDADKLLEGFKIIQKKYSADIIPSDDKIAAELAYNKYNVFKKLIHYYLSFGALLFIFLIIQIFNDNKFVSVSVKVLKWTIVLSFLAHTLGLIARWYISGHAPWSDAYESIIYVSWATMLFGLIFGRKSDLTLASTAFVASMLLWVANLNFIDPAIGNLQPVLDSYWLMIHVAIIVASYGPFTLGAILGVVALLLMIFTNDKNKKKIDLNIKELTIINEMTLTVGLVMLTIGNFLGGMWANESWGRYWGWDPKETWALISIMIYAFVIHMRLVPGLRGKWFYNWISIFALAFIIFTYFGVNFYLVGLHSYASGDKTMSYQAIAIAVVIWIVLGIFSYQKYKKYYKK